jgi:Family of unknown function (DUF6580)
MFMKDGNGSGDKQQYGVKAAAGLMLIGTVARLIPHPANFTPVGGTSLFAGARLKGWHAYLIPLLLMAVTDPLLYLIYGYPFSGLVTPVIYGAFLINVWIGRKLLVTVKAPRVAAASLLCSFQFFVLTNLGVWMLGNWYPHTIAGLVVCFAAAVPFLAPTMVGDLAYTGFLFGLDALAGRLRGTMRREAEVAAGRAAA